MSFLKVLAAIINKKIDTTIASSVSVPFTQTPLFGLRQRSVVKIDSIPMILASGAGSLFKTDMPDTHNIPAIGQLDLPLGFVTYRYYRAYLSKGDGAFIHLVVSMADPNTILECRLYQPYKEIGTGEVIEGPNGTPLTDKMYASDAEATAAGWGVDHSWEFWLTDDSDPNVGGFLGCPIMQSDAEDGPQQYARTWIASDLRVAPIPTREAILDATGGVTFAVHQLMHYGRVLNDNTNEYMLVSALETDTSASIMMWVGIDIKPEDLTIAAA